MKTEREIRAHHLYKFLYKHNLFGKFVRNVATTNYNNDCMRVISLNEFLNKKIDIFTFLTDCVSIGGAFTWSATPEGHGFWEHFRGKERRSLERLWKDYIVMKT